MLATDQIYLARQSDRDEADATAAEEAERWEWHATHQCAETDLAVLRDGVIIDYQPCCPECWHRLWKKEGAALIHKHMRLAA